MWKWYESQILGSIIVAFRCPQGSIRDGRGLEIPKQSPRYTHSPL